MVIKMYSGTFRQVSEQLANDICPDNQLFSELMSNMADTQERIVRELLNDNQE